MLAKDAPLGGSDAWMWTIDSDGKLEFVDGWAIEKAFPKSQAQSFLTEWKGFVDPATQVGCMILM